MQDTGYWIQNASLIGWDQIHSSSYPESWVLDLVSEYNGPTGKRANGQTG